MPEVASLATPFSGPGGRLIASPFQFVTDDDTKLRVVSANSQTGVRVAIQGRRIDSAGQIQIINETHTPNTDRSKKTQDYTLGKGAILNLTVVADQGTPLIGQTYVMVQLIRGAGAAVLVLGTLLGGLVTSTQALGFPGSPIQTPLEVEPVVRNIRGTQPAAGSEISEVVPAGARWDVLSVFLRLVPSGAGVTRFPNIQAVSGGQGYGLYLSFVGVDPGATWLIQFAPNLPLIIYAGQQWAQSSMGQRVLLRAGDSLVTATIGLDAGDQYSPPNYQVREWLEVS